MPVLKYDISRYNRISICLVQVNIVITRHYTCIPFDVHVAETIYTRINKVCSGGAQEIVVSVILIPVNGKTRSVYGMLAV